MGKGKDMTKKEKAKKQAYNSRIWMRTVYDKKPSGWKGNFLQCLDEINDTFGLWEKRGRGTRSILTEEQIQDSYEFLLSKCKHGFMKMEWLTDREIGIGDTYVVIHQIEMSYATHCIDKRLGKGDDKDSLFFCGTPAKPRGLDDGSDYMDIEPFNEKNHAKGLESDPLLGSMPISRIIGV